MAKKIVAAPAAQVEPQVEAPETYEIDLFDVTPVQVNGVLQHLPKGKQLVGKQIYDVLKDANLI